MTEPRELLAVTGAVTLQAADGDRPPRFAMDAYSGGRMRPVGFALDVVLDLSGLSIPEQSIPSYVDHDRGRLVGHTTSITNDRKRLAAQGIVSATGDAAREIRESAANGFPWKSSIGASIDEREFVAQGESARVNGRTFEGPLYVVHKATLREISFVSLAGDPATSATVTAKDGTMPKETTERTPDDVRREERERLQRIEAACSGAWGDDTSAVEDLRAQAVAGTLDVDQLESGVDRIRRRIMHEELVALRASRPTHTPPGGAVGGPALGRVLEAALSIAAGIPEEVVARGYDERTMNAALSSENRGVGIKTVFEEIIRAAGRHVPRGFSNETIRLAFEADMQLRASGFSTVSLPGILGNVANKAMLTSYEATNVAWPKFCRVSSNPDFKPNKRYRLHANGSFQRVGADGELKHISLTEQEFENQLDTHGAMIALTRHMIVNDDADAFLVLPRILGRLSALVVEEMVFALLLSNPGSMFHANNGNLLTGAGSVLAIAGLTAADEAFENLVDPNGKPLLANPEILLVPSTLKTTGRALVRDTTVEVVQAQPGNTGTAAERTMPGGNPHAGRFEVVSTPYLNNVELTDAAGLAFSGQSDTHWYLTVRGGDMALVDVAFLDGKRMPTIEQGDTSFNTLGVQWRGYTDAGVAAGDRRGGVRSAGA